MAGLNQALFGHVVEWAAVPTRQIRPGVRRQVFSTDEIMIARHELEVGMELRPHHHDDFEQLVYIAAGRCNYFVSGTAHRMGPGSFLLVPRGAEHYVEPTEGPCINIDLFVPPRADIPVEFTIDGR